MKSSSQAIRIVLLTIVAAVWLHDYAMRMVDNDAWGWTLGILGAFFVALLVNHLAVSLYIKFGPDLKVSKTPSTLNRND